MSLSSATPAMFIDMMRTIPGWRVPFVKWYLNYIRGSFYISRQLGKTSIPVQIIRIILRTRLDEEFPFSVDLGNVFYASFGFCQFDPAFVFDYGGGSDGMEGFHLGGSEHWRSIIFFHFIRET